MEIVWLSDGGRPGSLCGRQHMNCLIDRQSVGDGECEHMVANRPKSRYCVHKVKHSAVGERGDEMMLLSYWWEIIRKSVWRRFDQMEFVNKSAGGLLSICIPV